MFNTGVIYYSLPLYVYRIRVVTQYHFGYIIKVTSNYITHTYKSGNDTTVSTLVWTLRHDKCCKGGTEVDIVVSGMTYTNMVTLVTS